MQKLTITNKKRITAFFLALLLVIEVMFSLSPLRASAEGETQYSNVDLTKTSVREDLKRMGEDKLSYLSDTENIFIGMSQYYDNDNQLHTYIYFNYVGSTSDTLKISISIANKDVNDNMVESYNDYEMCYVNSDRTLAKYEILGLSNLDTVTRRYKLDSISAKNKILNIDETYIFHGITNETIEVFNQTIETITITEKEVAFFCYGEESKWFDFFGLDGLLGHNKKYTDAWYIFFNTDKPIDDLLEIEITYKSYNYHIQQIGTKMSTAFTEAVILDSIQNSNYPHETIIDYGEQKTVVITPGTSKVVAQGNWWSGYETKYQNIDNIMDLRKYDATDENGNPFVFSNQAEKYAWGVNFLNTEKTSFFETISFGGGGVTTTVTDGSGVCNTAILRLKYEVNGIVKNAYAIDIPTDDFDGNSAEIDLSNILEDIKASLREFFKFASLALIAIVLIALINPIFTIIKFVFSVIVCVIEFFVSILTFPFRSSNK